MSGWEDPSRGWLEGVGIDYDALTDALVTVFGDHRPEGRKPGEQGFVAARQVEPAMALMRFLEWPEDATSQIIRKAYGAHS